MFILQILDNEIYKAVMNQTCSLDGEVKNAFGILVEKQF